MNTPINCEDFEESVQNAEMQIIERIALLKRIWKMFLEVRQLDEKHEFHLFDDPLFEQLVGRYCEELDNWRIELCLERGI